MQNINMSLVWPITTLDYFWQVLLPGATIITIEHILKYAVIEMTAMLSEILLNMHCRAQNGQEEVEYKISWPDPCTGIQLAIDRMRIVVINSTLQCG